MARKLQRIGDIVVHAIVRVERERLRHVADVAFTGAGRDDVFTAQGDAPGIWFLQAREQAQQRGLATCRPTEQHRIAALAYTKIDPIENGVAAEALADGVEADQWVFDTRC